MEQRVEYVYHWERIIGALAILLALLGMLALGLYQWLTPAPETTEIPASDRLETEVAEQAPVATDQEQRAAAPSVESQITVAPTLSPPLDTGAVTSKPTESSAPAAASEPAEAAPVAEADPLHVPERTEVEPSLSSSSEAVVDAPASSVAVTAQPPEASLDAAALVAEQLGETTTPSNRASGSIARPEDTQSPSVDDDTRIATATSPPAAEAGSAADEQNSPPLTTDVGGVADPPPTALATVERSIAAIEQGRLPPTASGAGSSTGSQPPTSTEGTLHVRDLTRHAAAVKRFVLAKSVVNLEPKGDIDDIKFDQRGMLALYCFSEVVGREHRTLEYIWRRNDKVVARVNVGVKGERWRSYSSKLISRRMTGEWRVELRGTDDKLLASAEFVL